MFPSSELQKNAFFGLVAMLLGLLCALGIIMVAGLIAAVYMYTPFLTLFAMWALCAYVVWVIMRK